MTSSQNKKIGQFIRETIKDAVLYSDEYTKFEYKAIETMLRMMMRANLMHPSTYRMFINVLTKSYIDARKERKEKSK